VLLAALRATGRARVWFDHRVARFEDHGDHVRVIAETPHGPRRFEAATLCGADGARSAVREQLGLALDGITYEDRFLLVGTDLDLDAWYPGMGPVGYIFDPDEWVIAMRLPSLLRLVFRLAPDADADAALADASIVERIHGVLGERVPFEIRMRAIYRVHQRVARRFRVGRTVVLGDAAHVNNPAGGMGMNSGIHDAYYLAEALASGDDCALDRWAELRRRAAVEQVQRSSDDNYKRMVATRAERRLRNRELQAAASNKWAARRFLLRASMMETRL
jgi:3-(3-hydroxy-phenyl)propionate hydroxylase